MLFRLTDELAETVGSSAFSAADDQALSNLLCAASEGHHRIFGTRSSLRTIAALETLRRRERGLLLKALNRVAQEESLVSSLSVLAEVYPDGTQPVSYRNAANQRVIRFPLRWFEVGQRIWPCTLTAENLSDVRIFARIAEVAMNLRGCNTLQISWKAGNGGGRTIEQVMHQHVSDELITLCVIDTDQRSPGGTMGQTARAVQIFKNSAEFPTCGVDEIQARELENILPDIFYTQEFNGNNAYAPLIQLLTGATSSGAQTLRAHVDIKAGVRLADLRAKGDAQDQVFWQTQQSAIESITNRQFSALPCYASQLCQTAPATCTCAIVTGISSINVLTAFETYISTRNRWMLSADLDISLRQEWMRVGTEVFSWCAADSPIRM